MIYTVPDYCFPPFQPRINHDQFCCPFVASHRCLASTRTNRTASSRNYSKYLLAHLEFQSSISITNHCVEIGRQACIPHGLRPRFWLRCPPSYPKAEAPSNLPEPAFCNTLDALGIFRRVYLSTGAPSCLRMPNPDRLPRQRTTNDGVQLQHSWMQHAPPRQRQIDELA